MLHNPDAATRDVPAVVDVEDEMDLAFWSLVLEVDPLQLRAAVHAVGTELYAVAHFLRMTGRRN